MQTLKVNYAKFFTGFDKKPESYRDLADNYEWARREVGEHLDQHHYDDFNSEYLRDLLGATSGKLVVECGCGLGGNIIPHAQRHRCVGIDYSGVALKKLRLHTRDMSVALGNVSTVPLQDQCADFVLLARVLFVHEDLDFIVAILREARRILKPEGKILIINGYSNVGVRVFNGINAFISGTANALRRRKPSEEFVAYYFSESDLEWLLRRAGLRLTDSRWCNIHQGIYHRTYLNKFLGLLLRDNWRHYRIRHQSHWERVRNSQHINDAYPLNAVGRLLKFLATRFWPSLAALSLVGVARRDVEWEGGQEEVAGRVEVAAGAPC